MDADSGRRRRSGLAPRLARDPPPRSGGRGSAVPQDRSRQPFHPRDARGKPSRRTARAHGADGRVEG